MLSHVLNVLVLSGFSEHQRLPPQSHSNLLKPQAGIRDPKEVAEEPTPQRWLAMRAASVRPGCPGDTWREPHLERSAWSRASGAR